MTMRVAPSSSSLPHVVERADAAAELHRDVDLVEDAFERLEVIGVVLAERRVEVDDVQHLRALVVPPFGDLDGVFGIDGFGGGLPLREPDTAPAAQINGWDDDHADVILMFRYTVNRVVRASVL